MYIEQLASVKVGNVLGTPANRFVSAPATAGAIATASATPLATFGTRAGDEAALEALYASTNGANWVNNTGWASSGMSLDGTIHGVTTATINGELRVTEVNLKDNNLTGSIDVPEIGNLKRMNYLNVCFNSLNTNFPQEIGSCIGLVYLYLSRSDDVESKDLDPHEHILIGGRDLHTGKNKGTENNVISGSIPSAIENCSQLEYLVCDWTESSSGAEDGLSTIPQEIWNLSNLRVLHFANTQGITPIEMTPAIGNMTELSNLAMGVRTGSGMLTGTLPAEFGNLTNLRFLRISKNQTLVVDFDILDLSGMTGLRLSVFTFLDIRGTLPAYFFDDTMPLLIGIYLNFPQGQGLTGTFPPVSKDMNIIQMGYGNDINGSLPADFWTVSSGIIQTEFYGNNLTSLGSTDLTMLTSVRNIRFANNNIGPEPWPYLNWSDPGQIDSGSGQIQLQGNRYVFSNMLYVPPNAPAGETIFELYQSLNLNIFQYSPQQPFGEGNELNGSTIDFSSIVTHQNNVYRWERNGSTISGETTAIIDTSLHGTGAYQLFVTNPGVSGLTLESIIINVE